MKTRWELPLDGGAKAPRRYRVWRGLPHARAAAKYGPSTRRRSSQESAAVSGGPIMVVWPMSGIRHKWLTRRLSLLAVAMVFAGIIVAVVGSYLLRASLSPPADKLASVELLVENFDQFVFGNEHTEQRVDHLRKWAQPITVNIPYLEDKEWIEFTVNSTFRLRLLSGFKFRLVDPEEEPANLLIVAGKRDDAIERLRRFGPAAGAVADGMVANAYANCTGASRSVDGRIVEAIILISTDGGRETTDSCTLEELVHALGFPNHSDLIRPSILNEDDKLTELSINDRILIRTLYDERLEPGMARDEALARAREIIGDLVERVTSGESILVR